ncbi:MAG: type II toxin-antitoxin system Phd/YefM family antitoxin [Bacteroidota bacterium]
MDIVNYSEFRQNMKAYLDAVVEEHKPLYITRKMGEEVVVLSKEDYSSLQETLYLLSSPKNASRLRESIKQVEKGKVKKRKLDL